MSRLQNLARRVRRAPKQVSNEDMAAWAASLPPEHPFSQPSPAVAAAAARFEAAGGIPAWDGEPLTPANAAPLPAPVAAPETDAAVRQMAEDYFRPAAAMGRHAGLANARPAPHSPPMNRARLAEVRDSLQNLPDRAPAGADGPRQELEAELQRQAAPRPVPDAGRPPETARQRASRFTADARKPRSGGLPLFRATGRDRGWAGLDSLAPAGQWAPWPAGQWAQAMAKIGAQTEAARAEIGHYHAETWQRAMRRNVAADVAPLLGEPESAE